MHIRRPSSRAGFGFGPSIADAALAATAPVIALYLRDAALIAAGGWLTAASYSLVSLVFSLGAFHVLRVGDSIPRFVSAGDLVNAVKAAVCGVLMTVIVFFTVTRLDGIPRSVPAIHWLILSGGLVAYRVLAQLAQTRRGRPRRQPHAGVQNVIWIGLNDWSVSAMRYLKAHAPEQCRVIAVLDEEPRWSGRSVNGVPIFGSPQHLEAAIEEFSAHGVRTDRVVMGSQTGRLPGATLAAVEEVCARHALDLVFVPQLVEFGAGCSTGRPGAEAAARAHSVRIVPDLAASPYLRRKRWVDAVIALVLIFWLTPLLVILCAIVFADVGWPLLFWQLRLGQGGRELQIHKFRTWRAPFDRRRRRIPDEDRISWAGQLLRRSRLDELPQLLNVLVGDMSLIGPRPLLARDQPHNATVRLSVRPGITGWAQVNGGAGLTPAEKAALDIWYIRNASLRLDLRIVGMTLLLPFRGERRSEAALAQAQSPRPERDEEGRQEATRVRMAPIAAGRRRDDGGKAAAVNS